MPIWTADYVLMTYGTGAVMAVPGGDERDFDFALAHDIPIVRIVDGGAWPADAKEAEKRGFLRRAERRGEHLECFTGTGRAVHDAA